MDKAAKQQEWESKQWNRIIITLHAINLTGPYKIRICNSIPSWHGVWQCYSGGSRRFWAVASSCWCWLLCSAHTHHKTCVQTGRLHIAAMNRKEKNATEAAILLMPSGPSFGTAGTHEFEFGLSTHPWDMAHMPRDFWSCRKGRDDGWAFDFVI